MTTKKSSMQIKRGLKRNLPLLKDGQLGYCKDVNELWIGNDGENVQIGGSSTDNVTAEFIQLLSPSGKAFKLSVNDNGELQILRVSDNEDIIPPETNDVDYTGLIINQVYGGGKDAACSHHFVELYNKSSKAINLEGVSLYGATYKAPAWQHIQLSGTIPPKCSYLIRGVESTNPIVMIDNYDLQTTLKLDKAMKVFLIASTNPDLLDGIVNPWNIDGAFKQIEGYIDGFGCHGNSGNVEGSDKDMIDGFETEAPGGGDPGTTVVGCGGNSKQTSMRRKNFVDTDVNSEDFEALRYANFNTDPTLKDKQPRWVAYGPWDANDKFGGESDVTGTVTINYVDTNGDKVANPVVETKLSLGQHIFNAIEVLGYSIVGDTSKTVTISEDNLVQEISFTYSRNEVESRKGLIINQYYGGGSGINTGSVSHAFIELYNSGNETISLEGKSIHYTATAKSGIWEKLELTGEVPAKHSFLIRCAHTNQGATVPPVLDLNDYEADMEWDMFIINKGVTVALMNNTEDIPAETDPQTLDSYIDMIGSSDDKGMNVPYFEGVAIPDQSKQKSVRRILFQDTNNNNADCDIVDFRYPTVNMAYNKFPRYLAYGEWDEDDEVTAPEGTDDFNFIPDQPTMAYNTFGEDPKTTRYFRWFTGKDYQGQLKYKTADGEYQTVQATISVEGNEAIHEVTLTGLTANTTYTYQLSAGNNLTEEATFTTAGDGDFEFLHVTDSQSTNIIGYEVFNRDLTVALEDCNANFIAHTGDIVEDNGTYDDYWRGFFKEAQSNLLNNGIVCVPGNNDLTIQPNGDTSLDNYGRHFKFANQSSITPHSYTFEYGEAFFLCIDYTQKLNEQKAWIAEKLNNTSKKWKIVLIHAAPYTSFKEDTFDFAKLFEDGGVDLVLCGHKHMYMRSYPMKNDAKVNPGEGPVYVMGNSMGIKQGKLDSAQHWMEVRLAPMVSCYNQIKVTSNAIELIAKKVVNNTAQEIDNLTLTKESIATLPLEVKEAPKKRARAKSLKTK